MTQTPEPTERELQILKVLWDRGEATVREVYEALRDTVKKTAALAVAQGQSASPTAVYLRTK